MGSFPETYNTLVRMLHAMQIAQHKRVVFIPSPTTNRTISLDTTFE